MTTRVLVLAVVAAIAIATPAILVVNGLRVVTRPWIVTHEYGRGGFPPDRYGLDDEERAALALTGLSAITPRTEGVELLERATLPDGRPAFSTRELEHMADVRHVLGRALSLQLAALLGVVVLAAVLARTRHRTVVPLGLLLGALLTLATAVVGLGVIVLGFDGFFNRFHELLFEPGTWRFPSSDTLIRLYPERFWEDVSRIVAGLTLLQAVILAPLAAWWWRRVRPEPDA